jgi:hypothetical protein
MTFFRGSLAESTRDWALFSLDEQPKWKMVYPDRKKVTETPDDE